MKASFRQYLLEVFLNVPKTCDNLIFAVSIIRFWGNFKMITSIKCELPIKENMSKISEQTNLKMELKCSTCEKMFSTKGNLTKHVDSVHIKMKPYSCKICDYACSVKADMLKHVESVHECKKPHVCTTCGKMFSRKGNLNVHIDYVHERIKPYKCKIRR